MAKFREIEGKLTNNIVYTKRMELDEDAKAKLKELFVALDEDGNGKLDVWNTFAFFLYGFRFRFRSWGGLRVLTLCTCRPGTVGGAKGDPQR